MNEQNNTDGSNVTTNDLIEEYRDFLRTGQVAPSRFTEHYCQACAGTGARNAGIDGRMQDCSICNGDGYILRRKI